MGKSGEVGGKTGGKPWTATSFEHFLGSPADLTRVQGATQKPLHLLKEIRPAQRPPRLSMTPDQLRLILAQTFFKPLRPVTNITGKIGTATSFNKNTVCPRFSPVFQDETRSENLSSPMKPQLIRLLFECISI
jgi:hypothetical protein